MCYLEWKSLAVTDVGSHLKKQLLQKVEKNKAILAFGCEAFGSKNFKVKVPRRFCVEYSCPISILIFISNAHFLT